MTDDTTVTGKNSTLALHAGCILLIAVCLALAFTVLKPYPQESAMLIVCAGWLYGKLGFKPANSVLENIIQTLEPARVEMIMSQRPPASVVAAPMTVSAVVRQAMSTGETVVANDVIDDVGLCGDATPKVPK